MPWSAVQQGCDTLVAMRHCCFSNHGIVICIHGAGQQPLHLCSCLRVGPAELAYRMWCRVSDTRLGISDLEEAHLQAPSRA